MSTFANVPGHFGGRSATLRFQELAVFAAQALARMGGVGAAALPDAHRPPPAALDDNAAPPDGQAGPPLHGPDPVHYWPCERLNAFVLQMAAHGRCVNTDMMLGHRPYAQEQLAAARAIGNEELAALAAQLQAYFDAAAPQACAVAAVLEGAA